MFGLGFFELTIFGMIALIVLGPEKLPHAARTLGKWYALIMHTKNRLTHEMQTELHLLETQQQIKAELAKLQAAETAIKEQMHKLEGAVAQNREQILAELSDTAKEPQAQPDLSNGFVSSLANSLTNTAHTTPMTAHWFLLGDYDKKRRLPKAPYLPMTQADALLFEGQTKTADTP